MYISSLLQDPWTNIAYAKSFHCRPPFGMASRRRTVSRSERAVCCVNGTYRIPIRILRRNANWPRRRASIPRRLAIGLRIAGNAIVPLRPRIGKFYRIFIKRRGPLSQGGLVGEEHATWGTLHVPIISSVIRAAAAVAAA